MDELYSRPLSPEAEAALITFATEYIKSMKTDRADLQAERAKTAAASLLRNTDIDILVFVSFCSFLCSPAAAIFAMHDPNPENVARSLVEVHKLAVRVDKQRRAG